MKDPLRTWCKSVWLYVVYAIGIVMLVMLVMNWNAWDHAQRIVCLLAVLLSVHVFEEDTFPNGFPYANNVAFGSDEPLVYPQNMATNMFTNLGASILFAALVYVSPSMPYPIVTLAAVFGIGQCIGHTRSGVIVKKKFGGKGKRTIYNPGLFTSYVGLLELSIYAIWWLVRQPFDLLGLLGGFGLMVFVAVGLILIPFAINMRIKSERFAFESAGYFDKYL